MIKISKGDRVLEVTSGAYRVIYKATGWSPVEETPAAAPQEPAEGVSEVGDSNPTPEALTASEELQEPQEDSEPQEDLEDLESQESSGESEDETLNRMSNDELRQYASLLGIQTKDLKGRKKLMEAIKAHQK